MDVVAVGRDEGGPKRHGGRSRTDANGGGLGFPAIRQGLVEGELSPRWNPCKRSPPDAGTMSRGTQPSLLGTDGGGELTTSS